MKPIKLSKNRNPTNRKQYEKPVESDEKPVEFYRRVLFSNEESGSCYTLNIVIQFFLNVGQILVSQILMDCWHTISASSPL